MLNKKVRSILLIIPICASFSACKMFPSSANLIKAPKSKSSFKVKDKIDVVVHKFMPEGMQLASPMYPEESKSIIQRDIDGDGKKEIIVTFKSIRESYIGGIMILKNKKDKWEEVLSNYGEGGVIYRIDFEDLNGDGKDEILISSFLGSSAGYILNVYKWKNDNLELIGLEPYNKIDLIDMPNKFNRTDGKIEIGLWKRTIKNIYNIDVFRCEENGLMEAEDVYPYYFKEAVKFYRNQVNEEENKDEPIFWYALAEAELKSENIKEALNTVNKCSEIKKYTNKSKEDIYPYDYMINLLKGKILFDSNKYDEAINYFKISIDQIEKDKYSSKDYLIEAYYQLGNVYKKLKDDKNTEKFYKKALDEIKNRSSKIKISESIDYNPAYYRIVWEIDSFLNKIIDNKSKN